MSEKKTIIKPSFKSPESYWLLSAKTVYPSHDGDTESRYCHNRRQDRRYYTAYLLRIRV